MKRYLLVFGFVFLALNATAQSKAVKPADDDNKVYTAVEVEPEPKGGMTKFYGFISKKIENPKDCDQMEIFHRIILTFIVEKDGTLTHFRFLSETGPAVQNEILRVMKLAPKWLAGKQDNKPVRVQYTIPFQFEP